MRNIKLIIEYIGTNYCGFQKQKNGLSIQLVLESAIEQALNETCKTYPSGRTDAGVHAMGQVVNFFTNSTIQAEKFSTVINFKLPKDIRIIDSVEVDPSFNSRKSAKSKTYIYKIYNKRNLSVFDENRCLAYGYNLNLDLMQKGAEMFVGEHNFSSFVASKSSAKTTIRTIFSAKFVKNGDYLTFEICGNGFLYNMVRIILGTLLELGREKISLTTIETLLNGNCRNKAGKTLPPDGLYLKEVKY